MAGGVLYATDAVGRLTAFDAGSGRQIWRVRVANPDEDSLPIGGGVAVGPRLVYATTGFGEVLGLDPANGALVWRTKAGSPVRSGPTVAGPVESRRSPPMMPGSAPNFRRQNVDELIQTSRHLRVHQIQREPEAGMIHITQETSNVLRSIEEVFIVPILDIFQRQLYVRKVSKFQRFMLVRTLMSVSTGIAIWGFASIVGLELATAWGVIAFVLNYIPVIGPFVATLLPTMFAVMQFDSW